MSKKQLAATLGTVLTAVTAAVVAMLNQCPDDAPVERAGVTMAPDAGE